MHRNAINNIVHLRLNWKTKSKKLNTKTKPKKSLHINKLYLI